MTATYARKRVTLHPIFANKLYTLIDIYELQPTVANNYIKISYLTYILFLLLEDFF